MPDDESIEEHADVRARLAAEPAPRMPDDIAARLHTALAEESRQRAEASTDPEQAPATVTPLRRPGRWKAPLLAAAAVVAVIAVAVPVINQSSDDAGGDGSVSTSDQAAGARESETLQGDSAAPDSTDQDGAGDDAPNGTPVILPALTRADFDTDVREQLVQADQLPAEISSAIRSAVRCSNDIPTGTAGEQVTLDGDPALVLTSRSTGVVAGTEVRAVVCGDDGPRVAARTTLPD